MTIPVSKVYEIELVAPGNWEHKLSDRNTEYPGVRIIGKFELKKGQKITAALGQQGNHWSGSCGSGGSFLVLESDEGQKPLLIAGGAGHSPYDEDARGSIKQAAVGNENIGTSGKQKKIGFFEQNNIYCAGAGFNKAPEVSDLADGCVAPKSYKEGLMGGKGVLYKDVTEGGFGGGGGHFRKEVSWGGGPYGANEYHGAGGGFTGGGTKVGNGSNCWGGGGGSFSADRNAKFDHHYVEYGYCKISSM